MKIAISGFTASGKSALAEELFKLLKPSFSSLILIKPTFKDLAKEKGISLMQFQKLAAKDKNIDIKFDKYIKDNAKKSNHCIAVSWLSIWDIKADLKIFVYANEAVRAKRVAKRDKMSLKDAKEHILKRDADNINRFKKLYNINITKFQDVADIILNSKKFSITQEAKIVLAALKYK